MNSVLNPEAPEFHPLLTNAVQDGFIRVNKTIKTSTCFPLGHSHDIYKTYTGFRVVTGQISENVVVQSNQIVTAELPQVKLKCSEIDDTENEKIIDVTDSLLDRININIDTLTGVNLPSEMFLKSIPSHITSWNNKPIIARIKVGDATFIGAKNIPRPQLCFKDPVDNSHSLWVPKISDKPNNIKPLALKILYNLDGEAVGYEHPYSVELDVYRPPDHIIAPDPTPPEFPRPLHETPLTLVDTEEKLDDLVKHLQTCDEIAVDVEHHSYRSYQGITCLIQITTYEGGDFLIDTIAIREHVHKLNHSFTDPMKVKILHGADNDVKWLQRDFGVYIVGLFDTFQAGRILKLPSLSLKNLLDSYCNVETDKKYQMADWRIRPLPHELIDYARTDTHYLLYMWRVMKQQLLTLAAERPTLLLAAFENSRHTCCLTYNKEFIDEVCHMELYTRSKKSFNSQQLSALKVLYKWRDAQAREMDEGPSYLIPNHMLLSLAETLPREMQGISACCSPMPPFVKINILAIHKMILSCRELPTEPTLYEMPCGVRTMLPAVLPTRLYNLHDLTNMPEVTDDQINLELAWEYLDANQEEVRGVKLDVQPDVTALANEAVVRESKLNVDAEMFIPPYERYLYYRSIAQATEIQDFKRREAKVAALSQGNELIKTEVLLKLQAQRDMAEACQRATIEASQRATFKLEPPSVPVDTPEEKTGETIKNTDLIAATADEENATKKASQRKRKIEKPIAIQPADDKKKEPQKPYNEDTKVKSFHYKNVNYKKFYSESDKGHKQPKMKLKKS